MATKSVITKIRRKKMAEASHTTGTVAKITHIALGSGGVNGDGTVIVPLAENVQVYGSTVLSSSFYDTGCDNIQFPLFRLAPNLKVAGLGHNGSRWWYWLSAVVSAAAFARCYVSGRSNHYYAAGDGGVRPISCMYTKCRLCADIRYRKGKLVLPKGKEAHLLIEGG